MTIDKRGDGDDDGEVTRLRADVANDVGEVDRQTRHHDQRAFDRAHDAGEDDARIGGARRFGGELAQNRSVGARGGSFRIARPERRPFACLLPKTQPSSVSTVRVNRARPAQRRGVDGDAPSPRRNRPSPNSPWSGSRNSRPRRPRGRRPRSVAGPGRTERGFDARTQIVGIVGRAEAVAKGPVNLRNSPDVGGDHRHPRARRLEHDVRHRFGARRHDQNAAELEGFANRHGAGEGDELRDAEAIARARSATASSGPEPTSTARGTTPRVRPTSAIASSSVSMPLAARNSPT